MTNNPPVDRPDPAPGAPGLADDDPDVARRRAAIAAAKAVVRGRPMKRAELDATGVPAVGAPPYRPTTAQRAAEYARDRERRRRAASEREGRGT